MTLYPLILFRLPPPTYKYDIGVMEMILRDRKILLANFFHKTYIVLVLGIYNIILFLLYSVILNMKSYKLYPIYFIFKWT